jgi:hypothetical protein
VGYKKQFLHQCTSQVDGRTTRSPLAPAFAHELISSLIMESRSVIDGRAPSKTQEFRCFQTIHGMRRVAEARPFRNGLGVSNFARRHQSMMDDSWSGAAVVILSHARVSCQACRVKGHSSIKCLMDSGAWSHSKHLAWCGSPCLARRSAVQHLSRLASQWKNFTFGGAHVLQMSLQE